MGVVGSESTNRKNIIRVLEELTSFFYTRVSGSRLTANCRVDVCKVRLLCSSQCCIYVINYDASVKCVQQYNAIVTSLLRSLHYRSISFLSVHLPLKVINKRVGKTNNSSHLSSARQLHLIKCVFKQSPNLILTVSNFVCKF